jgi:hypothetical protein
MTTKDRQAEDRAALERMLEVHGADRTRWPARERLKFASLICEDEEAQRLVKEAAALDALLDLAPRAGKDREHALKERIVAAALKSAGPKLAVVPGRNEGNPGRWQAWARRPSFAKARMGGEWPAAALLAASLVLGVLLGSVGAFESTVAEVAEATGLTAAGESSQLALGEEIIAAPEEDLL